MTELNISQRRRARRLLMQALYQWQMTNHELHEIQEEFYAHNNMGKVDTDYFNDLLFAIPKALDEVDAVFSVYLDRSIEALTPIELTVLRIGSYELAYRSDIPYKVVINEALELNKKYGTEEGYKYVNGILDKVAHQLRTAEFASND